LQYNTTGNENTAVGATALNANTTGFGNTAVGDAALSTNQVGGNNTAIGDDALLSTTVSGNTAVGALTLFSNTTGGLNTAVGSEALQNNVTGSNNTAIGGFALFADTVCCNTAIGNGSLQANTSGSGNTGVGYVALNANTTGAGNTAVGQDDTGLGAYALINNTATGNTAVGFQTLQIVTTGANNTAIGAEVASTKLKTGTGNILIGTSSAVDTPTATTSNFLDIGNVLFATGMTGTLSSPAGSVGIGTTAPAQLLHVWKSQDSATEGVVENPSNTANASAAFFLDSATSEGGFAAFPSNYALSQFAGRVGFFSTGSGPLTAAGVDIVAEAPTADMHFYTGGALTTNERMRITAAGNVGIGTTTPQTPLDIHANSASVNVVNLENTNTAGSEGIQFTDASGIIQGGFAWVNSSFPTPSSWANSLLLSSDNNNPVIIVTNLTERMRITGAGNVGIGTTSPQATLDINGATLNECVTVSTLPSGHTGMRHCVTDATSCGFMSPVTGGGSTVCPVFYTGSAWVGG
jgi:hypothetical protein